MYDNIFENQLPMPGIEPSTTFTLYVVSNHANHYTTDTRMRWYFNLINGIILNVWIFFWKSNTHTTSGFELSTLGILAKPLTT